MYYIVYRKCFNKKFPLLFFHIYPGYPHHRSVFHWGPATLYYTNSIFSHALFTSTHTYNTSIYIYTI